MSARSLPKIELHHHLEGAAAPGFVRQLASEQKVDLSNIFDERGAYSYRDFWHFLDVYEAATSVLKSPEHYARLVTSVLEETAEQGVVYLETFLSPDFCGDRDVAAWKEYLHAMEEAATAAEKSHGITLRGIITAIRHFGPDKAKETALCAQETFGSFIRGFGLAGDEKAGKPGDFAYAFDMAREAGMHLTAHAGEWGGPRSVADAIRDLKVERIGHGVRAIEDPKLVEYLAASGIVLEVCPGSNVTLGVYPSLRDHPIARLRDAGVKVTVSTDDPPFFHSTMTREYDDLAATFGWDEADFANLNKLALDAAFCDDDTRARIAKKLETPDV